MAEGHIPTAVGGANGKVDHLKSQFPIFKGATIILYNHDGNLSTASEPFKTISEWGCTQVSVLDGGFAAWKRAGEEISTGPVASEIKYVRRLFIGEIEVAEFKALLEKPNRDKIVLDVRGEDEIEKEGVSARSNQRPFRGSGKPSW